MTQYFLEAGGSLSHNLKEEAHNLMMAPQRIAGLVKTEPDPGEAQRSEEAQRLSEDDPGLVLVLQQPGVHRLQCGQTASEVHHQARGRDLLEAGQWRLGVGWSHQILFRCGSSLSCLSPR